MNFQKIYFDSISLIFFKKSILELRDTTLEASTDPKVKLSLNCLQKSSTNSGICRSLHINN